MRVVDVGAPSVCHRATLGFCVLLSTFESANRYANDLEPELELARHEHIKKQEELASKWKELENRTYYRRTHTWQHIRLHSEEKGPYIETGRSTRTRDIYDVDPAYIEEEVEVVEEMTAFAATLLKGKPQAEQIETIRARLNELKTIHQRHAVITPPLSPNAHENLRSGFIEHFRARNQHIQDWLSFLIDTSHRHEAHARLGYVGLELERQINQKYQTILDRLKAVARRFRIAAYTISATLATGAAGTACYYLLIY